MNNIMEYIGTNFEINISNKKWVNKVIRYKIYYKYVDIIYNILISLKYHKIPKCLRNQIMRYIICVYMTDIILFFESQEYFPSLCINSESLHFITDQPLIYNFKLKKCGFINKKTRKMLKKLSFDDYFLAGNSLANIFDHKTNSYISNNTMSYLDFWVINTKKYNNIIKEFMEYYDTYRIHPSFVEMDCSKNELPIINIINYDISNNECTYGFDIDYSRVKLYKRNNKYITILDSDTLLSIHTKTIIRNKQLNLDGLLRAILHGYSFSCYFWIQYKHYLNNATKNKFIEYIYYNYKINTDDHEYSDDSFIYSQNERIYISYNTIYDLQYDKQKNEYYFEVKRKSVEEDIYMILTNEIDHNKFKYKRIDVEYKGPLNDIEPDNILYAIKYKNDKVNNGILNKLSNNDINYGIYKYSPIITFYNNDNIELMMYIIDNITKINKCIDNDYHTTMINNNINIKNNLYSIHRIINKLQNTITIYDFSNKHINAFNYEPFICYNKSDMTYTYKINYYYLPILMMHILPNYITQYSNKYFKEIYELKPKETIDIIPNKNGEKITIKVNQYTYTNLQHIPEILKIYHKYILEMRNYERSNNINYNTLIINWYESFTGYTPFNTIHNKEQHMDFPIMIITLLENINDTYNIIFDSHNKTDKYILPSYNGSLLLIPYNTNMEYTSGILPITTRGKYINLIFSYY